MTINKFIQEITSQYSSQFSEGLIAYDQCKKLNNNQFEIVKNSFGLQEEFAQYLECTGNDCDDEMEVRRKPDGTRYAACSSCGRLDTIDDDQDLVHKITLDGLANFLVRVLEIKKADSIPIKANEALYLGSKTIEELGDLTVNFYLLKNDANLKLITENFRKNFTRSSAITIRLDNVGVLTKETRMANCLFSELTFYDQGLSEFGVNYKILAGAIKGCFSGSSQSILQKLINEKCQEWFAKLIRDKVIKKGEKERYKSLANEYFNVSPNKFNEIWRKQAPAHLKSQGAIKRS